MAISQTLYSSRSEEWPTPNSFFEVLDEEFAFTLDLCAIADNTKCRRYFTKRQNGLTQDWGQTSRLLQSAFNGKTMGVAVGRTKCLEASQRCARLSFCFAHARTDTRWFQLDENDQAF